MLVVLVMAYARGLTHGFVTLICVIFLGTQAYAMHLEYQGTTYPMRWGASDDVAADTISPYPVLSNPVCFQTGSAIGVTWVVDPGDPPTVFWIMIDARLRSVLTGEVYWTY